MANEDHVNRLKRGVVEWNAWREDELKDGRIAAAGIPSLLRELRSQQSRRPDLRDADLRGLHLTPANLIGVDLTSADLRGADLRGADFTFADLRDAKLGDAKLMFARLRTTDLRGADLTKTMLGETLFSDANLTNVIGLETCKHHGPSVVDRRTIEQSGPLPLPFLRGVGLPDNFIDYIPSLFGQAINFYSCFISYSAKDDEFAKRIHADLQNNGVRCWSAPHDMPIGGKIIDEIDTAIRLRDKVLLILSEHSIKSNWVEDEVSKAFEEERKRERIVLFPVRIDDAVMDTNEAWAAQLRRRHIGDFRGWKDHDGYKRSFDRVLRDLTNTESK